MIMTIQNKRRTGILLTVVFLLMIPLVAMQFTKEVNWTFFDFVVAAALLTGTGLLCELVMRKLKKASHRIALCAAILIILILVWIELAVGIFGTAFAGH
jgi:Kef-type K+ transport system membrane component KefB